VAPEASSLCDIIWVYEQMKVTHKIFQKGYLSVEAIFTEAQVGGGLVWLGTCCQSKSTAKRLAQGGAVGGQFLQMDWVH
jgi:hypothetical protein